MRELTLKQGEVLNFIKSFIIENQNQPRYLDICNHFDFSSVNGATNHIKALRKKGYLSEGPAIRVIGSDLRWVE